MLSNTFRAVMVGCMATFAVWADGSAGLPGTYTYVPDQSADVPQAIDTAIERMNFIKRPIARGRLSRTNIPYKRVHIEITASEAVIRYDDQAPVRMPINGQSIKWKRADGEVFDVSATLEGAKLHQTYKAEDGMRVNSFSRDAAGSLRMQVEVSSPQLPQPLKYELVYRPAS